MTPQEIIGWQWHQLDHVQIVCISLQSDNHASTSSLSYLQAGCSSWLMPNQQCQSTEGNGMLIYWFINTIFKLQGCGHCSTNCCYLSKALWRSVDLNEQSVYAYHYAQLSYTTTKQITSPIIFCLFFRQCSLLRCCLLQGKQNAIKTSKTKIVTMKIQKLQHLSNIVNYEISFSKSLKLIIAFNKWFCENAERESKTFLR